jgi:hypothetical protein
MVAYSLYTDDMMTSSLRGDLFTERAANEAYNRRRQQEEDYYADQLKRTGQTKDDFDYKRLAGYQGDLLDRQFNNTGRLMDLSNRYRTKEGATQGQMDEQAYRRLDASLTNQRYLATTAVQSNRDADFARSLRGLEVGNGGRLAGARQGRRRLFR